MNCTSCGTELPENAHFCGNCGTDLTQSASTAEPKPRSLGAAAAGGALVPQGPMPGIGDLFSQALELYKPNLVPLLVGTLLVGIIAAVGSAIVLPLLVMGPLSAGLVIMVLQIVAGKKPEVPMVFAGFKNFVPIFLVTLIVGLATGLSSIIPIIGPLAVGSLLQWAPMLVIDRKMEFMDAIKASVDFVKADFVPNLVLFLVVGVVAGIGSVACGVGALLTMPLALCIHVLAYHKLFGIQGGADELVAK